MSVKTVLIFLIFCVVIVGAPTDIWMLGHIVRGLLYRPWDEFLNTGIQVAPFGISVGVIFALVISTYEGLLKAIKERQ